MSNSIVGNNGSPVIFHSWFDGLNGELVDEENIFGYRAIVPNNSNSNTVTIFYYYQTPTSEWYWDYNYGVPYKPITPVVFSADASWKLTQCLNASFAELSLDGQANGWKSINVTLKRNLVKGERIIFGIYSDLLGYVATSEVQDSNATMCYFYWSNARRDDYPSQVAYISSQDFIWQQTNIFCDYEMCIFMQYENEPNGYFYTRSVIGNIGAAANFTERKLRACRTTYNAVSIFDFSKRILSKKISYSENINFSDRVQKLLVLIRTCFSQFETSDDLLRKLQFQKSIESTVENKEEVCRSGEIYKSFEDDANIYALPFASRLFYRAVETVMSFWDWLKGKIREANYVVNLFTPVVLEVTLDGKNMNRIYKGKTKLRVMLDCECDLSGYTSVSIKARKPDGITDVIFPAVVKDAEKGIIFYDVQSENDFDVIGWWTLWPLFVFYYDRTNCGRAQRAFVYEEGT